MLAAVMFDPDALAAAGFPTFGRVEGKAVMIDALLDDGRFLVHYCGLEQLNKGPQQFVVHKQNLLDF